MTGKSKFKQMEDLSGIFITKKPVSEALIISPEYKEIGFCVWGYHHTNGKKEKGNTKEVEGSITQYCKGSDIISNMYDTKLGKVCLYCYKILPSGFKRKSNEDER